MPYAGRECGINGPTPWFLLPRRQRHLGEIDSAASPVLVDSVSPVINSSLS